MKRKINILLFLFIFLPLLLSANEDKDEAYFWLTLGQGINRNFDLEKVKSKTGKHSSVSFNFIYNMQIFTVKSNQGFLINNENNSLIYCKNNEKFNDLSFQYGLILKTKMISFSVSTGLSYLKYQLSNGIENKFNCDLKTKYGFGIPFDFYNIIHFKHFGVGYNFFTNYNEIENIVGINFFISVGVFKN